MISLRSGISLGRFGNKILPWKNQSNTTASIAQAKCWLKLLHVEAPIVHGVEIRSGLQAVCYTKAVAVLDPRVDSHDPALQQALAQQ